MRILKTLVWSMVVTVAVIGLGTAAILYNGWSATNRIIVTFPFELKFYQPFRVEEIKPTVIVETLDFPTDLQNLPPIETYIVKKFGVADAKIALAVARAESNMREDAVNLNGGKSLDMGIFQINSVHWNRPGCSLKELVDPYKNVDCAYSIFKEQGWNPWVAHKTGAYLSHVEK